MCGGRYTWGILYLLFSFVVYLKLFSKIILKTKYIDYFPIKQNSSSLEASIQHLYKLTILLGHENYLNKFEKGEMLRSHFLITIQLGNNVF